MSMPQLLLVDDSEAVLAFEVAALAGHYNCATATNGKEALEKVRQLKPAVVLLDLSMPVMDGDEVLALMRKDPALVSIPVVVVSSERARAEACRSAGANAVLHKPVRAAELVQAVERVLEDVRLQQRKASLPVLPLQAGAAVFGIPLAAVAAVLDQVMLHPLAGAPQHVMGVLELKGEPHVVVDLAARLGDVLRNPVVDRKLVVLRHESLSLAFCVDEIRAPEEVPAGDLRWQDALAGTDAEPLKGSLVALAQVRDAFIPVLNPAALFSDAGLSELAAGLKAAQRREPQ